MREGVCEEGAAQRGSDGASHIRRMLAYACCSRDQREGEGGIKGVAGHAE
jgi:hypothetical protein